MSNIDPLGLGPFSLPGSDYAGQGQGFAAQQTATAYSTVTGFGVNVEVSTINPVTSSGGGQYGLNLEYTQSSGWHLYKYYTPKSCSAGGYLPGVSVTGNIAYGSGDWTGLFNNYSAAYDWMSGGFLNSPDFTGGGYYGINFGWGKGPAGFGTSVTNYEYVYPQSQN